MDQDEPLAATNTERPSGILTTSERKYLLGESDIEPKSGNERGKRQAIRKHLLHALLDFEILLQELEDRDLRRVMCGGTDPTDVKGFGEYLDSHESYFIQKAIPSVIGLLHNGDPSMGLFPKHIETGIERSLLRDRVRADVEVSINIEQRTNLQPIIDRYKDQGPEAISTDELGELHRNGVITAAEFASIAAEKENSE